MSIPNDPMILLSFINTKLRDFYPTLDELGKTLDVDTNEIIRKLDTIGYSYDEKLNRFIWYFNTDTTIKKTTAVHFQYGGFFLLK